MLLTFSGCATIPKDRSIRVLNAEEITRISHDLHACFTQIDKITGAYTARVSKPGIDISFSGAFLLRPGQTLRVEVYSPFGVLTHRLDVEDDICHLITPEGHYQENAYDFLMFAYERWGIELAPYQFFHLFSGSLLDPERYSIQMVGHELQNGLVRLQLTCIKNHMSETIDYSPVEKKIVRRAVTSSRNDNPINLEYGYSSPNVGSDREKCAVHDVIPSTVRVHQQTVKASLYLTLNNLSGSVKPSEEVKTNDREPPSEPLRPAD